jgi:hypothetical protein
MSVNSFSGQPAIPTSYGFTAGKNKIINGDMGIWQRGTSAAGSYPTYLADRWMNYRATTGSTFSRQNTNDTTNLPNIQYCQRLSRDSGNTATNPIYISQSIETLNSRPFAGQTVVLSFYARAGANFSAASSNMSVELYSGTGTDQNVIAGFTGASVLIGTTKTLTTTWQRFTATGTVPTTSTQLGINLYYTPVGTAGAADYMEITGVQLELGSVATPFSRAGGTIQGELAACQRYYWRNSGTGLYASYGAGYGASTTVTEYIIATPVTMRVAPTSVDYANLGASIYGSGPVAATSVTLSSTETTQNSAVVLGNHASGITQYRPYFLANNNSASGYIGFSAEL